MPFSQFTTARLEDASTLVVTGPFGFADDEPATDVTSLHFVVIQGSVAVHGDGGANAAAASWDGTAEPANKLGTGPAQGFGVAVLVRRGPSPTVQTFTWSDSVEITK
jgi:hypothetical protein